MNQIDIEIFCTKCGEELDIKYVHSQLPQQILVKVTPCKNLCVRKEEEDE